MPGASRLDHVIAETADIQDSMRILQGRGYPEVWPVGPFWPNALTSGVCVGAFNLELLQPLDRAPGNPAIQTLVFEPTSLAEAADALRGAGLSFEEREKIEPSPELLRLRGFSEQECRSPQRICTNLIPLDPPFPFFFCLYAPTLKARLTPEAHRIDKPVQRILYGLANYEESIKMVRHVGLLLPPLEFAPSERNGVLEIYPPIALG